MTWKDPKASAAFLGVCTVVFAVQRYYGALAPAVYTQAACVLIVAMWGWAALSRSLNRRGLVPPPTFLEAVDEKDAGEVWRAVVVQINKVLAFVKKLYLGDDFARSATTVAVLFGASHLLRVVHLTTLLYLAVLFCMAWPTLYTKNKRQIDDVWGKVQGQRQAMLDKVQERARGVASRYPARSEPPASGGSAQGSLRDSPRPKAKKDQ